MPRKPRFYLPGIPAHIVQRGNCRQAVFFDDIDYHFYLDRLSEGCEKYGCQVHAYVLMTNHVHLLMTPTSKQSISKTMQFLGRNYVTYVNKTYAKSGTLWEGRHKGSIIESDEYLLACMRYIEMNPVRAGMVNKPVDYPWSSYSVNAAGEVNNVVSPHERYLSLGPDKLAQQFAYRELFRQSLESVLVHDIRTSVQTGTPLGNDRFREYVEQTLECKVGQSSRGRPKLSI